MTATEQLIAKQVSDVFPASVDDLPLAGRGPPRADRAAARPARAARRRDQLGADRRRRLRPGDPGQDARPPGAEPGRGVALPRPLRQHAGHRLRRRRRPRVQPRAGVPRRRAQGGGRLGRTPPGQARRDARRVRARRDQRADQRDAARRGMELTARDGLHASRADRVEARLPAAHRPHHAHCTRARKQASSSTSSRRRRRTTSASSRCTRCSTPTSTARARA